MSSTPAAASPGPSSPGPSSPGPAATTAGQATRATAGAALSLVVVASASMLASLVVFQAVATLWRTGPLAPAAGVINLLVSAVLVLNLVVASAWLWRARARSERLMPGYRHRHTRMWVVLGWVVPVVALWFPRRVVTDVWRASALRTGGDHPPLAAWWWSWVGWFGLDNAAAFVLLRADRAPQWLPAIAPMRVGGALLLCIALVLWARVVKAVDAVQPS